MDSWDVLHRDARPTSHYSIGNIGEAIPGVQTPLSWTVWCDTIEITSRRTYQAVGAYNRREGRVPVDPTERINQIFYGRPALRMEPLALLGDRLPGTTGPQVLAGLFGDAPQDMHFAPTRRRYPFIAAGLPVQMLRVSRRMSAVVADTAAWYPGSVGRAAQADLAEALELFRDATARFRTNVEWQMTSLFCAVQPHYDLIVRITARAGAGDPIALTSGFGGVPETEVVHDLWQVSRGRMELAEAVRLHGYHGPLEGELSAKVWREDDAPLRRLVDDYAACDDAADPQRSQDRLGAIRRAHEQELLAAVPAPARPALRLVFRRLATIMPLRGSAKNAFLQAFDVARASARRAGHLLHDRGVLADPDDVFYLTDDELMHGPGPEVRERVDLRRERRRQYQRVRLPETWSGTPEPILLDATEDGPRRLRISGTGVSAGVVEGRARVVTDPSFTDVDAGEILVASTTDPSWSSIMFVSAGLVVDIGGVMSHAAVVARDLGIPCVVNTRDGSRQLCTGDLVRVDGTAGTVDILKPATPETTAGRTPT